MKFIIASLPRSGSTAVYRVIQSGTTARVAYEPTFFDDREDISQIKKTTSKYLRRFDGIKHVWDPNGWPFRNRHHVSTLSALMNSDELILPNKTVLECGDRIVLLRRRNAFDRTLSDLWGQQTGLWGHDPHQPYADSEVQQYRAAALRHVPAPIDPEVFGWYMHNAERWEKAIIDGLSPSTVKILFFEDLFGSDVEGDQSLSHWRHLTEWLDMELDFNSPLVRQIISPKSKLNSVDIYKRIPNFEYLNAVFCK